MAKAPIATFTIAALWRDYLSALEVDGLGPDNEAECRQAFYAGVFAMLGSLAGLVKSKPSEAQINAQLRACTRECAEFLLEKLH